MQNSFKLSSLGLEVEVGKIARQADGSVWIKSGNNIVLCTAVAAKEPKEFMGFFPLTVEYREKYASAGKIPGGYIKREGRLSDFEILTSRLIDRSIRPLFPNNFFNEVQILSTVYSYDGKFPTEILSIIGSSLALTISNIPFFAPVGAVQASKIEGEWKFNLDEKIISTADSNLVIAGTSHGICMVEGHCNDVSEEEFVDVLFLAHKQIKEQIKWQLEIQEKVGKKKFEISKKIDWDFWYKKVKEFFPKNFADSLFVKTKEEHEVAMNKLRTSLLEHFESEIKSDNVKVSESVLIYLFDSLLKELLPDLVFEKGIRIDGRKLNEIRPINIEVSLLPMDHGSALFTRGETQALGTVTLGTAKDAQKIETLSGVIEKHFMLHYNFPPFATGEVKMMRGVGRREIGHGYLAESSFLNVLPSKDKFPYTIRVVSDILESNGSSSMATVCAATMSLMDAGVNINDMVGGIAMGLMKDSKGNFHVLTDILGTEDAFGLMDFKVAGTEKGIMAIQMDVKLKAGITREFLLKALIQAKQGRLFILDKMKQVLASPRKDLSKLAPRFITLKVPVDKIGGIIGPSGKIIKDIIAKTGAEIDIHDDGTVMIYAKDSEASKKASEWINILAGDIKVGSVYNGIVKKIVDFGIFVELVPGKEGLIHISSIAKDKQRQLNKLYKINDPITVKVISYDKESGRVSLVAPDLK